MNDIADAYEAAYIVLMNLNKSWLQRSGDFFVESPIVLFAAIIWYLKYTTMENIVRSRMQSNY